MGLIYRGYRISKNTKSVRHRNPISGHHWSDSVEQQGYTVSGKGIPVLRVFKTIKAAQEHIDFIIKFPFEIPRSERELEKAKSLGLI